MKIRVLVVDDSAFFRKRITEALEVDPQLEVISVASNGIEAIEQVRRLSPDVITMDIEMPEMNGIDAVRHIMDERPTPILMFSSLTYEGAQATLDALDAGALDFLPKQLDAVTGSNDSGYRLLRNRVAAIARRLPRAAVSTKPSQPSVAPSPVSQPAPAAKRVGVRSAQGTQFVAIGASTGGPVAVQKLLSQLPADFPVPVVTAIHMPANFTTAYADRLDSLCKLRVREAVDGDKLEAGLVLLAPGGKQIVFERRGAQEYVRVQEGAAEQIYRPSVDIVFGSAAKAFGAHTLAIILTGMGADGAHGAKLLKQSGAEVWSQDEASCVVFS